MFIIDYSLLIWLRKKKYKEILRDIFKKKRIITIKRLYDDGERLLIIAVVHPPTKPQNKNMSIRYSLLSFDTYKAMHLTERYYIHSFPHTTIVS